MKLLRFRYGLCFLFGVVALVAVGLGLWRWQTRGHRAVRALQKLGAEVEWIDGVELIHKNFRPFPPEEQYHSVSIGGQWRGGDKGLALLPHVPRTRELWFTHLEGFDDSWLSIVPNIRGLRDLTVKGVPISDAGVVYVSQNESLRKLGLARLDLSDADLASLKQLRNLEELSFNSSSLDDASLKHVKDLPELVSLMLTLTDVTDAAMRDLNPRLMVLHLEHTTISDKGLADLRHLRGLQYLFLSSTEVTNAGMPYLNELPKLRQLSLYGTRVTEAGVALLDRAQGPDPELDVLLREDLRPSAADESDDPFGDREALP